MSKGLILIAACGLIVACSNNIEDINQSLEHAVTAQKERLSHTVNFQFDSKTVDDEYLEVINAHAQYLKKHPEQRIHLQGSADKEGANDYNYKLGAQRAAAVAALLIEAGVSERQILISSVGSSGSNSNFPAAEYRRVVIGY